MSPAVFWVPHQEIRRIPGYQRVRTFQKMAITNTFLCIMPFPLAYRYICMKKEAKKKLKQNWVKDFM